MNASCRFLLTGAGFTHNFGGFLAKDMWAFIFNNDKVQKYPSLLDKLRNNLDFEEVYHELMSSQPQDEKDALHEAIYSTYQMMDNILLDYNFTPGSPYPVNIYLVQKMISAFAGKKRSPGFIFTLNQDLFLERHYYNFNRGSKPSIPGVKSNSAWFSAQFHEPLKDSNFAPVANIDEIKNLKDLSFSDEQLYYIKLHGSCNWISASGSKYMIIGQSKDKQIQKEPLLQLYFDVFRECLSRQDAKLLIIGYGFRDLHVNELLANCITNNHLKLYLLYPEIDMIKAHFAELPNGKIIWSGVMGAYVTTLEKLFPADQSTTMLWKQIVKQFFEGIMHY